MTTLRRAKNGDWLSRKRIPSDVRSAYQAAFGLRQEERFRRPSAIGLDAAKREFRDWDAETTSRIERLRAQARGEGEPQLSPRQAHSLAGVWYSWLTARFDDDPGSPDQWDVVAGEYLAVCRKFQPEEEHSAPAEEPLRRPAERRAIHAILTRCGDVERFLLEQGKSLSDDAMAALLDAIEGEFLPALRLLRRRAEGDWTPDSRPDKFPPPDASSPRVAQPTATPSGLTAWTAFKLWIEERKPAPASVNRWRAIFVDLRKRFGERDAATISPDDAQGWADGLTNAKRSAHVVHEVWLRAAKVIFGWAVARKRLQSNPFASVSVALPKRPPKLREREFNEDEWRIILRATLEPPPARMEQHNAAARKWVPWICAYTGSRPGEACQLRAEDISQHSAGFWVMRITPEAGAVKGGKAREVPLHNDLVHRGFVTFAKARGKGPLFYDPGAQRGKDADATNPKRPPYVKARQKLAAWTRSLGINDPGLSPMHAWRHTFNRRAARAGIEKRIRFGFCGHTERDVGDKYATPTLEDLAAERGKFPAYEI